MARQNRVLPTGEIVADPARGTLMGNRGVLHDAEGRLGRARWRHQHWICCVLEFKDRRRQIMAPGRYTELFFLDEAVALAAGHRPCAECRRADYLSFREAWARANGPVAGAPELDRALHAARLDWRHRQRRHRARAAALPDGAMFLLDGRAHLAWHGTARPFAPEGYGPAAPLPAGEVTVLTPRPVLGALAHGFVPRVAHAALARVAGA